MLTVRSGSSLCREAPGAPPETRSPYTASFGASTANTWPERSSSTLKPSPVTVRVPGTWICSLLIWIFSSLRECPCDRTHYITEPNNSGAGTKALNGAVINTSAQESAPPYIPLLECTPSAPDLTHYRMSNLAPKRHACSGSYVVIHHLLPPLFVGRVLEIGSRYEVQPWSRQPCPLSFSSQHYRPALAPVREIDPF
jgi:hypothetical protein